jgi:hypothetical protein
MNLLSTGLSHLIAVATFAAVLLSLGVPGHARAEEPGRKLIEVTRATGEIEIDGLFDEEAWAHAEVVDSFVQVDPEEGAPPTERTEIRVLFDDDYLYLAIRMLDRDPSGLIAKQMILDGSMTGDDRINLSFDTFDDHRNAYFFQINPLGTRSDGLIENNSTFRRDWNGIWYAKASVDAEGWSAEFAIPFKTVAFAKTEKGIWGFEAERYIRRKNERVRWANYSNNRSVLTIAGIGALEGLTDVTGTGVDVKPSLSPRASYERTQDPDTGTQREKDLTIKPAGDVFYKFHPSVTAGITINTDFIETPVDDRRTVLSRFPPLLVERRAFFLQDAGIFEFGGLTGNGIPYRTRAIGRTPSGAPLDIDVGVKLTGRLGNSNFGGLYVHLPAQDGLEATDLAVGRVQFNVLGESAVGLIGTYGNPLGESRNGLVGGDFQFSNSKFRGNSIVKSNGYFMQTFTDGNGDSQQAFGGVISYPNDRYNGWVSYHDIGSDFNPALGSAFRTGIRRVDGNFRYRIRPKRFVRTLDTAFTAAYVANRDGETETRRFSFNFLNLTNSVGDNLTFTYVREFEHLRREPFKISEDVEIPLGAYDFDRYAVKLTISNARPVRPTVEFIWGTFFSGELTQATAGLELRPTRYLFLSLEYSQNDGDLDEGDFAQRLARIRVKLAFTPQVSWSNVLQYDNVSDRMGLNSIFRWEVSPGNDVYFVFNYHWQEIEQDFIPTYTDTAIKAAWTFRF